jgi:hypothetical protein
MIDGIPTGFNYRMQLAFGAVMQRCIHSIVFVFIRIFGA